MAVVLLLAACERPPIDSVQRGYRGTGMVQIYNPALLEAQAENNVVPPVSAAARVRANAPKAGAVYQNIRVLGDLSIAEFGRTMDAITAWVAPVESCAYCHVEGNFADDGKYTKVVARRMIQMVQHLNTNWKTHVAETGVTCYTCHRGKPLPEQVWFMPEQAVLGSDFMGNRAGQNAPAPAAGLASLPSSVFKDYLRAEAGSASIRVAAASALPVAQGASTQQTESTYSLMVHMSQSLGVNCTYCHNSRAFASWDQSSPQRVTAWHGIRMARDVNSQFLDPLGGVFPAVPEGRLGPTKDAAKVHCATCHQGAYKPLYGAATAQFYPALYGPGAAEAAVAEGVAGAASAAPPAN
jgi:photosynthetic reaction center cytochrome c subunit